MMVTALRFFFTFSSSLLKAVQRTSPRNYQSGVTWTVEKVDSLMDRKLKVKAGDSSPSSSSSESELSSLISSNGEGKCNRRAGTRKVKHRSGKSKTLTSYAELPQKCPGKIPQLSGGGRIRKKFRDGMVGVGGCENG